MQDRRQRNRTTTGSELVSDARLYHQTQAANLTRALLLQVCGVRLLREEAAPLAAEQINPSAN